MGVTGPKPKPLAMNRLHGNPGKRAERKGVPEPAIAAPDAPRHLNAIAKAEWDRIVPQLIGMRILAECDRAALSAYCTAWARYVRAEEKIIQTEGELTRTPNGMIVQSPWISMSNRAMEMMHKFLTEFGLTPVSRMRLGRPAYNKAGSGASNSTRGDTAQLNDFLASDPDLSPIH